MDKETSEIAKLTGRISQDPKSKLFVPLAEEYKKAGDLEMAIHVLLEGLKHNPDYVTARSSLGKLLLAKGDMAGAQKEFEEVVKTSPENLMAQKKLGDLAVVQNRPQDAIPHYKIALSLNPNDEELASLISDLEAGRDVGSKIQLTKVKASVEQTVKQEPPSSPAARESASTPVSAPALKAESPAQVENPPVSKAVSLAQLSEAARTPVSSVAEKEEPEEVLIVEPLEPEMSEPEPTAAGFDLAEEQSPEAVPAVDAEERPDTAILERSHIQNEPAVSEDIHIETDLFKPEDLETIRPAVSEETAADDIVDAAFANEITEIVPETTREEVSEKSDDFTTDTLAELYIAQGFFEKAIEIYERMLADNPNSRGLQDKLEGVRAAAVQSGALSTGQKKEPDSKVEQEVKGYGSVAAAGAMESEPSIFDELAVSLPNQEPEAADMTPEGVPEASEYIPTLVSDETPAANVAEPGEYRPGEPSPVENLFAESGDYKPAPGTGEHPTAGEADQFDELMATPAVQEQAQPTPQYLDFEPREYVPSTAEKISLKPDVEKVDATANAGVAGRKEAIVRLETWLTHIKKER